MAPDDEGRRKTMSSERPSREEALLLLKEYNQTDSLIKHALAVEAVMRYFARSGAKTKKSGESSAGP